MGKEERLKKLKFYDRCFWVLGISLVIFFFGILVIDCENNLLNSIWIISLPFLFISIPVITWGMIYHEYHRKDWCWLWATIIIAFIGGAGFFVSVLYYFFVMRNEFKKGKGEYEEEFTEKDKKRLKHYQEHKTEKDNAILKEKVGFMENKMEEIQKLTDVLYERMQDKIKEGRY